MSTTSADFVTRLRASGVVPPEQLDEFFAAPTAPPADASPKEILTALIAAGLVTKFQAGLLRAGKYKGFRLGSYVILDKLGAGGMGQVFRARHATLPKEVAIKVLPPSFKTDPIALARFVREARTCAAISHPNIVGVYDVLPDADPPHILMEYVPGISLLGAVTAHGVFAPCETADVGVQTCTGLQKACEVGLVHRDIKPPNLLLTKTGQVKILDFGIARIKSDDDGLTMQGDQKAILGTADYLAPEQAVDSSTVDSRADIYATGATLYFLLAGHPPFPEKSTTAKLIRKQVADPPPVHTLRPDVPPGLSAVIQQMLARDPAHRPPTPAHAAALLAPFARTGPDYPGRFFGAGRKSPSTVITFTDGTEDQTPSPNTSSSVGHFTVPPFDPTASHTGAMSYVVPPQSGVFVPTGPGSSFFAPAAGGFEALSGDELEQLGESAAAPVPPVAPEPRGSGKLLAAAGVVAVLAIGGLTAALSGVFAPRTPPTEPVHAHAPPATYAVIGKLVPKHQATPVEPDGFVRDWLLLGPLPLPGDAHGAAGLNRELVPGEPNIAPKADDKVRYRDKELTWRTCSLGTWDIKMRHEFPGSPDHCAGFAVAYIFSPADLSNLKLKFGSNDQARIWLNGKAVAEHLGGRGSKVDDSVATGVALHKGTNTLVFKVVNGNGDWGGGLRFTDADDKPVTTIQVGTIP
jgi:serine/threonine-protein kinase